MASARSLCSNYPDSLPQDERRRYSEKLLYIDSYDPYDIPVASWSKSSENLPCTNYADIVNYVVFAKSAYTLDQFKAYKTLGSYKLFVAGWVRDIWSFQPTDCRNIVVTAKVSVLSPLRVTPVLVSRKCKAVMVRGGDGVMSACQTLQQG